MTYPEEPADVQAEFQHCVFCWEARPAFCIPLERFVLEMPDAGTTMPVRGDMPICEECERLFAQQYFRQLANRCASKRIGGFRDEGLRTIEEAQSRTFFLRLLKQITLHRDPTRDTYANPWLADEEETDERS